MQFAILGWSYKTTPIEVREQLSLSKEERGSLGQRIVQRFAVEEIVILSTCNRTELYMVAQEPAHVCEQVCSWLVDYWGIPELQGLSYHYLELEAVQHLFRVSASLDSMVLGEPQILGQVKEAYHQFAEEKLLGKYLKVLFPKAFTASKRVRSETGISNFAVSISFAAVELAKRIFNNLSKQTVMVIGAGEMAELAIKHLIRNGVSKLLVTNRTFPNAVTLAEQYHGSAIQFEQLGDYLSNADIVIASTGARNFVVTAPMIKNCLKTRKGRPMFLIDIAVPRDIDPQVNHFNDVYCYDIDDLQNVVDQNRKDREKEAQQASTIVDEEVHNADAWFKTQSAIPTIRALRQHFHQIGDQELAKTLTKLSSLPENQKELIQRMVYNIVNKLLHEPSCNLKTIGHDEELNLYIETAQELFNLSPTSIVLKNENVDKPMLQLVQKKSS